MHARVQSWFPQHGGRILPRRRADLLRRAMGKKQVEEDGKAERKIRARGGCPQVPEKKASKIFYLMDKFAGYGFNKSHSAAYALLAYQNGYLEDTLSRGVQWAGAAHQR